VKVLVGDVGGTHTRLALFDGELGAPDVYESASFPLEALIEAFLAKHAARVEGAVIGIAATVRDGRGVESTNLRWPLDAQRIARAAGVERALLVNDVEACAHGLDSLEAGELATLNAGDPGATGNRVVISVGTGLGQAALVRVGGDNVVVPSEAGYTDFASRNNVEAGLRAWLAERYGHVSYERVCSGPGLADVHRYLTGESPAPEDVTGAALDLMLSVLGAFAANSAVSFLASGGVYLAGGIPARVVPALRSGGFLNAFVDKGLLSDMLAAIPVRVVLGDRAALLGAARLAKAAFEKTRCRHNHHG
jgi:glucokinase